MIFTVMKMSHFGRSCGRGQGEGEGGGGEVFQVSEEGLGQIWPASLGLLVHGTSKILIAKIAETCP